MKSKKIFTNLALFVTLLGIMAPMAEASSFSRMVKRKTNAINSSISSLKGKVNELGVSAVFAEFQGVYAPVGRQNDIFVFCDRGMGEFPDQHYWISVNPIAGQFQITNWYSVNPRYIPYFVVLCPYGKQIGKWEGPGTGAQFKANPSYNSDMGGSPLIPSMK